MTIEIDGSQGEGGGQMLRSALSLSILTGKAFHIGNIRAGRQKPGLMRQHLTCVRAAQEISGATVEGAALGSTSVRFSPGGVRPGTYEWTIGTAGSTSLVLQTVLLPLAMAGAPSALVLRGGTHNMAAPSADFLAIAFLPLLARIGLHATLSLERHGFYPAGGGQISVAIAPADEARALTIDADAVADISQAHIDVIAANIGRGVAEREVAVLREKLDWRPEQIRIRSAKGPQSAGNILTAVIPHGPVQDVITDFGHTGVLAEQVAADFAEAVLARLRAGAPVGPHLADQLLLPMAMARGGSFVTVAPTPHTMTNMDIIECFTDASFDAVARADGRWLIEVTPATR